MKNSKHMKDMLSLIGVVAVFFGFWLSEKVVGQYGENGRTIILAICVVCECIFTLILIIMKKYLVAFVIACLTASLLIMFIGMYLDNIIIIIIGLVILLVLIPVMTKVLNRFKK